MLIRGRVKYKFFLFMVNEMSLTWWLRATALNPRARSSNSSIHESLQNKLSFSWEQLINERSFGSLATISATCRALSHLPCVALWTLPSNFFKFFRTHFWLFKRVFLVLSTFWFSLGLS